MQYYNILHDIGYNGYKLSLCLCTYVFYFLFSCYSTISSCKGTPVLLSHHFCTIIHVYFPAAPRKVTHQEQQFLCFACSGKDY